MHHLDSQGVVPPQVGAPGEIRTHNRLIRSQMLYPLSYEGDFVLLTL
jgi:hypothetical protein